MSRGRAPSYHPTYTRRQEPVLIGTPSDSVGEASREESPTPPNPVGDSKVEQKKFRMPQKTIYSGTNGIAG